MLAPTPVRPLVARPTLRDVAERVGCVAAGREREDAAADMTVGGRLGTEAQARGAVLSAAYGLPRGERQRPTGLMQQRVRPAILAPDGWCVLPRWTAGSGLAWRRETDNSGLGGAALWHPRRMCLVGCSGPSAGMLASVGFQRVPEHPLEEEQRVARSGVPCSAGDGLFRWHVRLAKMACSPVAATAVVTGCVGCQDNQSPHSEHQRWTAGHSIPLSRACGRQ